MIRKAIVPAAFLALTGILGIWGSASSQIPSQKPQAIAGETGISGGRLVVAQRTEPKTLNPVSATDGPSREVIHLMTADLIHINRYSQKTEPALAQTWTKSTDGRTYILQLRQ